MQCTPVIRRAVFSEFLLCFLDRLSRFLHWFGRFLCRVEGVEAFGLGGFEQLRRGGDKDDFGVLEHVAGDECGGQLERVGPAQSGAVEELARGFEDGRVQRLWTMRAASMRRLSSAEVASSVEMAPARSRRRMAP